MRWTTSSLKQKIKTRIQSKGSLVSNNGDASKYLLSFLDVVINGFVQTHNTWQQEVLVNNIIFNGGYCGDGYFVGPAIGNSSIGIWTKNIIPTVLYGNMMNYLPSAYITEITNHTKAFINALSIGISQTFNDWLAFNTISNATVETGVATCTFLVPVGVFSGIGSCQSLSGCIQQTINKNVFIENIKNSMNSILMLKNETDLTTPMKDFINAIVEGFLDMQTEWLLNTKIMNIQVSGVAIYTSPISGAIGINGVLI